VGTPNQITTILALLVAGLPAWAQSIEPPAAGRPERFSGLVGSYDIATHASSTDLHVLDPLVLTIKIVQTDGTPLSSPPERGSLRILPPSFARDFYVEPLPVTQPTSALTWEYVYRLKPKHAGVKKIPALKLWYFDPRYGRYQVTYSRAIALHVSPRPAMPLPEINELPAPDRSPPLVTGPGVLRREAVAESPGAGLLILLVLGPPSVCAAAYVLWRRLHPDATRQAGRLRTQAARRALQQLRDLPATDGQAASGAIVAEYLCRRLDLPAAEPTPGETLLHLRRARVPPPLTDQVQAFFAAFDALRFAPPAGRNGQDLRGEAVRLIQALEAEPCLSQRC
jgi:hypothetical protein